MGTALAGVAPELAGTEAADTAQPAGQVGVIRETALLSDDGEFFVSADEEFLGLHGAAVHDVFAGRQAEAAFEEADKLTAAESEEAGERGAIEVVSEMLIDVAGDFLERLGGETGTAARFAGGLNQAAEDVFGKNGADAFDVEGAAGVVVVADLTERDRELEEEDVAGAGLPEGDAYGFGDLVADYLIGEVGLNIEDDKVAGLLEDCFMADAGADYPDRRFVDGLVLPATGLLPAKEAGGGIEVNDDLDFGVPVFGPAGRWVVAAIDAYGSSGKKTARVGEVS